MLYGVGINIIIGNIVLRKNGIGVFDLCIFILSKNDVTSLGKVENGIGIFPTHGNNLWVDRMRHWIDQLKKASGLLRACSSAFGLKFYSRILSIYVAKSVLNIFPFFLNESTDSSLQ